jgi:hypothetical protein
MIECQDLNAVKLKAVPLSVPDMYRSLTSNQIMSISLFINIFEQHNNSNIKNCYRPIKISLSGKIMLYISILTTQMSPGG